MVTRSLVCENCFREIFENANQRKFGIIGYWYPYSPQNAQLSLPLLFYTSVLYTPFTPYSPLISVSLYFIFNIDHFKKDVCNFSDLLICPVLCSFPIKIPLLIHSSSLQHLSYFQSKYITYNHTNCSIYQVHACNLSM